MNENQIVSSHALFFQSIFYRPDIASDFIKFYLPKEQVDEMKLNELTLERESFIDEQLKAKQSDVLYKVPLKNGNFVFVYILLEHKSYVDRWVLFQLLGYIVRIGERERSLNKIKRQERRKQNIENNMPKNEGIETEYLTPVIPVILYHGDERWNVSPNMYTLYSQGENNKEYTPGFSHEFIDLSRYSDQDIKGAVFLKVALLLMKHIFDQDLDEKLPNILSLLNELINQNSGIEYLAVLLRYVSTNKGMTQESLNKHLETAFAEKGGKVMFSVADNWIEKGIEQGIEKGIEQGIEKGMREMIMDTLIIKFNSISQSISNAIESIKQMDILRNLHKEAVLCHDMSDFQRKLYRMASD